MAKVLVTGGAGFFGSHVVDGLIAEGHDVLVVDNLTTGAAANLSSGAEFVDVDVADDAFVEVAKSFNPSAISHVAAQASVPISMSDPVLDARVNILGGLNVWRAAVETGCEQVLYINTGGALYGEPDYLPCDEEHPIRPVSGYALSKWTSECYFRMLLPESIASEGAAICEHLRAETESARGVGCGLDLHTADAGRRDGANIRGWGAYERLHIRGGLRCGA